MQQLLLPFNLSEFAECIGLTRNGEFAPDGAFYRIEQQPLVVLSKRKSRFGPASIAERIARREPVQLVMVFEKSPIIVFAPDFLKRLTLPRDEGPVFGGVINREPLFVGPGPYIPPLFVGPGRVDS